MRSYISPHNLLINLGGLYMSWEALLAYTLGGFHHNFLVIFPFFVISPKRSCICLNSVVKWPEGLLRGIKSHHISPFQIRDHLELLDSRLVNPEFAQIVPLSRNSNLGHYRMILCKFCLGLVIIEVWFQVPSS